MPKAAVKKPAPAAKPVAKKEEASSSDEDSSDDKFSIKKRNTTINFQEINERRKLWICLSLIELGDKVVLLLRALRIIAAVGQVLLTAALGAGLLQHAGEDDAVPVGRQHVTVLVGDRVLHSLNEDSLC